jgi:hypothetical protein
MDTDTIPDWLKDHTQQLAHAIENNLDAPDPRFPTTKLERELRQHNLECLFERILDKVSEGGTASDTILLDHNKFTPGEVMRWIKADPKRTERYREAQKVGAEVIADQMIGIADGDGMEDVQRSTLRIKTRQYILEKNNKERYGADVQPTNPFSGGVTIVIGEVAPSQPKQIEHTGVVIDG